MAPLVRLGVLVAVAVLFVDDRAAKVPRHQVGVVLAHVLHELTVHAHPMARGNEAGADWL